MFRHSADAETLGIAGRGKDIEIQIKVNCRVKGLNWSVHTYIQRDVLCYITFAKLRGFRNKQKKLICILEGQIQCLKCGIKLKN